MKILLKIIELHWVKLLILTCPIPNGYFSSFIYFIVIYVAIQTRSLSSNLQFVPTTFLGPIATRHV